MAITYKWICSDCDVYPSKNSKSNVVHAVHWILRGTDDANKDSDGNNITSDRYGTQDIDTSDLSNFKNWSELTASDTQGWVEDAMGEEKVKDLKAAIDADISEKISPNTVYKKLG
mgnify:FL=1|tara:strand:- start:242 stop:586 length:345 start_codon:yes stop_codon:yes gene_type:complete